MAQVSGKVMTKVNLQLRGDRHRSVLSMHTANQKHSTFRNKKLLVPLMGLLITCKLVGMLVTYCTSQRKKAWPNVHQKF